MQHNNNNASVANELEDIALSIASEDKSNTRLAIENIQAAHNDIEIISQLNELKVLRAISHWVSLNTELDDENEDQIAQLLEQDCFSNWIDVLASIMKKSDLSLLPILYESLTAPNWLTPPSAMLLKNTATWISTFKADIQEPEPTDTVIEEQVNNENKKESIDKLIDHEIDKAIQSNEEVLIQKNAFEEIGTIDSDKNNDAAIDSIEIEDEEHQDNLYIANTDQPELIEDVELSNNDLEVYQSTSDLEFDSLNDESIEESAPNDHEDLEESINELDLHENTENSLRSVDFQSADFQLDLNNIITNFKNISVNSNDVFASNDLYSKQLDQLILLGTGSEYKVIVPIAEWCQYNLQLFEKNPSTVITDFIQSGSIWRWVEQLGHCITETNTENCIKNLSSELAKKEWLEPIDTNHLEALLHRVKIIDKNTEEETTGNKVDSLIESNSSNNIEEPELIDINETTEIENSETIAEEISDFQVNWNDDTHPELLMVYLEETPIQIAELTELLYKINKHEADQNEVKLAARLAHTIKGGSSIVGITALSEFAYRLETLLDFASKHKLSNELNELLPSAADCLNALFDAVQLQSTEPSEFFPLFKQLDQHVNNLEVDETDLEISTPELPKFIEEQNQLDSEVTEDKLIVTAVTETLDDDVSLDVSINEPIKIVHEKSPFSLNWDDDVHPELLVVYLEETPTQINELVPLLHKINEEVADSEEKHTASRMAHTIKGASALVGITALSEFSYRLETLLDYSVSHPLSSEILLALPKAAICLEELFAAVELQDDEPEEFYSLFLQLDQFVNNLDEVDDPLELSTPELPDFIQNQNNSTDDSDSKQENELEDEEVHEFVEVNEQIDKTESDALITAESVSLEKLDHQDDRQNISDELDDIVMNLVSLSANNETLSANLELYFIELERFDLITEISGYPELALLSQWSKKNLEIIAQQNASLNDAFENTESFWSWIEYVSASLSNPEDMSHMSALSEELMREEWPHSIVTEDLQTILLALRHSEEEILEEFEVKEEVQETKDNAEVINSESNISNDNKEHISWDDDVHPELLAVYLNETPDQINTVAQILQQIVKNEAEPEDFKKAARIAHTIKGASGVVGINSLVDLTHNLEDILDYAITNTISTETSDLLAEASDCLESLFENIQNKEANPEEFDSVLSRLIEFSASIGRERITPDYMLDNEETHEIPENSEALTKDQIFADLSSNVSNNDNTSSNVSSNEAHIRVPVSVIDKLLNLAGELVTTSSQVGDKLNNALLTNKTIKAQDDRVHKSLDELSLTISRQEKEQKDMFSSLENSGFDSLEMDSYNELHSVASLLSETFVDGQELDNNLAKQLDELNDKLRSLDKLNKDMSEVILRSRMVSIDTIVPRLERIVRQTCRKTGKQAELFVTGNEINIDTDILNGLVDPLLHLLRNSIDHGIENPEQRLENNKEQTGRIKLDFRRDGNNILMSLQDDGAGIDPEIIYQKAIVKKLITPEQAFSTSETLKLILTPGFSTQENVSDISGRGVGMDVVNTSVEELNGSLSIDSDLGENTRINLSIPLTLITNTTLMVQTAENIVAIPTDTIEQILYQQANSVISRDGVFYVTYEDQELEIKSLSQLLSWSNQSINFEESFSVLIIKNANQTYAVHIDSIISSREVVVKSLDPWISSSKGVVGACHLNDGGVAPVINLVTVLKQAPKRNDSSKAIIETVVAKRKQQILVVDDSLSNRKALSLIIDKTEYDVLTAVDGMDALQIMNENNIDLVFTDLEMPRMNGLELTQAIRAWTAKSEIPIVMITSRTTQKHRDLANKAGVDGYLTKPVVTETLLETIDTCLTQNAEVEV